jgi:hypothetical protein
MPAAGRNLFYRVVPHHEFFGKIEGVGGNLGDIAWID